MPSAADVSQTMSPAEKRYGRPIAAFFALAAVTGAHRSERLVLRPTDTALGVRLLTIRCCIAPTTTDGVVVKGN